MRSSRPSSIALLATLPDVPLLDLVGRPSAGDELQPVAARTSTLDVGGEDLDRITRLESGVERYETAVDLGANAAMPDVGVNRVGEVDRRRSDRQLDDLALRREDEDLVLIEIELQVRHELRRVGCLLLPLDDAVQPREVATRRILLVVPVGRHAMLGAGVHLPGAQLHFERLALRPTTVVCNDW